MGYLGQGIGIWDIYDQLKDLANQQPIHDIQYKTCRQAIYEQPA